MPTIIWLDRALIVQLHNEILAATGGASGIRDEGLLDSALARPVNRCAYEGVDDIVELAATTAVALAKNHPFIDGNKRAAFMGMAVFLEDNGLTLVAEPDEATRIMYGVAASELDIAELADRLRGVTRPLGT